MVERLAEDAPLVVRKPEGYGDLGDGAPGKGEGPVLGFGGLYGEAEAYHDESLALWRALGDECGVARPLNYLGVPSRAAAKTALERGLI